MPNIVLRMPYFNLRLTRTLCYTATHTTTKNSSQPLSRTKAMRFFPPELNVSSSFFWKTKFVALFQRITDKRDVRREKNNKTLLLNFGLHSCYVWIFILFLFRFFSRQFAVTWWQLTAFGVVVLRRLSTELTTVNAICCWKRWKSETTAQYTHSHTR